MSESVSVLTVPSDGAGRTAGELLRDAGVKDAAVARVNGELRDLAHVVAEGDSVEAVPYGSDDGGRRIGRHRALQGHGERVRRA